MKSPHWAILMKLQKTDKNGRDSWEKYSDLLFSWAELPQRRKMMPVCCWETARIAASVKGSHPFLAWELACWSLTAQKWDSLVNTQTLTFHVHEGLTFTLQIWHEITMYTSGGLYIRMIIFWTYWDTELTLPKMDMELEDPCCIEKHLVDIVWLDLYWPVRTVLSKSTPCHKKTVLD